MHTHGLQKVQGNAYDGKIMHGFKNSFASKIRCFAQLYFKPLSNKLIRIIHYYSCNGFVVLLKFTLHV